MIKSQGCSGGVFMNLKEYCSLFRTAKVAEPPCKGHTYKGHFHTMRMLAKCMKMIDDGLRV